MAAATLPKTDAKKPEATPAPAAPAPVAPPETYGGIVPVVGSTVWFGLRGPDGAVRPCPATLLERSPVSGLWTMNVQRQGTMWCARNVPFSPALADGAWTWPTRTPPAV